MMLAGNQVRKTAQRYSGPFFAFVASAALLAVFYRELIASGFDRIPGNDGDSLLYLHILEHWSRSLFLGQVSWLSLSSFFPLANMLGYSDSMFLFWPPFAIARSLSVDMVTAYQFTLLFFHIVGYVAFYHFLRSALQLGRLPAVLGAALGTLNNAFYTSIGHTQLFVIGLLPVALLLLAAFFKAADGTIRSRRPRWFAGSALAILLPMMLYTGYYVTWFLIFFGVLASVVFLLVDRLARSGTATVAAGYWLVEHKKEMLAYLLIAAAALTPFLMTYLPVLHEIGGRPFDEVRATLPNWFDFFNVGMANVLWSSLFTRAFPQAWTRPLYWELSKGTPPFTLLVFFIGALWGIRSLFSRKSNEGTSKPALHLFVTIIGISVIAGWLLEFRFGNDSLWRFVHEIVPGGSAIRAVFRFQHVILFGVATVIAAAFHAAWEGLNTFPQRSGARWRRLALVAGAALMLAEQLNSGLFYEVSKSALLAELGNIERPPSACVAFFVIPPERHTRPSYAINTKAMLMADRAGIPTLNGYTSGSPPNWGLDDVYVPDYISHVVAWLNLHQIHDGICSLSLDTWKWEPFDIAAAPQPTILDGALPDSGFKVRLEMIDTPQMMTIGEQRRVSIRVINLGTATLSSVGKYPVRLSYQWRDTSDKSEGFNYRTNLPASLRPGESIVMAADLQAPKASGHYHLDIDLVQELIAWFRNKGAQPYSTNITIIN